MNSTTHSPIQPAFEGFGCPDIRKVADQVTHARRVFDSALHVAKEHRIPPDRALDRAIEYTRQRTGFDWRKELGFKPRPAEPERPPIDLSPGSPNRFRNDLGRCNGPLSPMKETNGLVGDWYRAYRHWCERDQLKPVSCKQFLHELTTNWNIPLVRKRYVDSSGRPTLLRSILLLAGGNYADRSREDAVRLGKEIEQTKRDIEDYFAGRRGQQKEWWEITK